jgi:hypothetical protein
MTATAKIVIDFARQATEFLPYKRRDVGKRKEFTYGLADGIEEE